MKRILALTAWIFFGFLTANAFAFEPISMTTALAALTAAAGTAGVGAGIYGMFSGKKKSQEQADPLASLRAQLQGLAGQVPGQVAKQKEINAARAGEARTAGTQSIRENVRGDRGFGASSIEDRLNTELFNKIFQSQSESDLNSDIWGTKAQADILRGTAEMYPGAPPEEGPSWQSQLMGTGANMAVQNWQQENQWKQFANFMNTQNANKTPAITYSYLNEPGAYLKAPTTSSYSKIGS